MLIEGIVSFGDGINISLDCLGKSYKSAIGDTEVTLHFPEIEEVVLSEDEPLVHREVIPPAKMILPPPFGTPTPIGILSSEEDDKKNWGSLLWYQRDATPETGIANVRKVGLTFETKSPSAVKEMSRRVNYERREWHESVLQWIKVISMQKVERPLDREYDIETRQQMLWFRSGDDSEYVDTGGHAFFAGAKPPFILTNDGVQRVFKLAGEKSKPELSWNILSDGYVALGSGDLRLAAFSAGTAVELVTRPWLEKRLASLGKKAQKHIIDNARMLGKRTELMKSLGWDPPNDLKQLIALRNDAAHKGKIDSSEQVKQSLDTARTIIRNVDQIYDEMLARGAEELSSDYLEFIKDTENRFNIG